MTLRVNRLEKADGSQGVDTPYLIEGSAKAWANLNGTGAVALRDSFNISSVLDNGTGDYTFNFSTSFLQNDYNVAPSSQAPFVGGNSGGIDQVRSGGVSTGSTRTNHYRNTNTSGDSPQDPLSVFTLLHGDLA